MEREACVCDHGFERSDLCAEIIIIIIIIIGWTFELICWFRHIFWVPPHLRWKYEFGKWFPKHPIMSRTLLARLLHVQVTSIHPPLFSG